MNADSSTAPVVEPEKAESSERVKKMAELIRTALDDGKAEDIIVIDLEGNSSVTDLLVIASGRSDRQVIALADRVSDALKQNGLNMLGVEGKATGDWVLIDGGDAIIHIFRPEVRSYYNLEKMWGGSAPASATLAQIEI